VRVLLVEDDDQVVEALVPALKPARYHGGSARRGPARARPPGRDGRRAARPAAAGHGRGRPVPADQGDQRRADHHRVRGRRRVRTGSWACTPAADDYIVKPFDEGELVARLYAVVRRGGGAHPPVGTGRRDDRRRRCRNPPEPARGHVAGEPITLPASSSSSSPWSPRRVVPCARGADHGRGVAALREGAGSRTRRTTSADPSRARRPC